MGLSFKHGSKILLYFSDRYFCISTAIAQPFYGVGGRKLEVIDPVGQRLMDAIAFFPSNNETGIINIGPYDVDVSLTASIYCTQPLSFSFNFSWIDRVLLHQEINAEIAYFFTKTLNMMNQ